MEFGGGCKWENSLIGLWIPKAGNNNNRNIAVFPIKGIGDYL